MKFRFAIEVKTSNKIKGLSKTVRSLLVKLQGNFQDNLGTTSFCCIIFPPSKKLSCNVLHCVQLAWITVRDGAVNCTYCNFDSTVDFTA